jgi:hypothetical protein
MNDAFYATYSNLKMNGVRISYPSNDAGYMHDTSLWPTVRGSFGAFMSELFDRYDIPVKVTGISNASRIHSDNTYHACVNEVALNGTDLCIGDFWATNERLLQTPFTASLEIDLVFLMVRLVMSLKCTPEMVGNGIEYCWGVSKLYFRRHFNDRNF